MKNNYEKLFDELLEVAKLKLFKNKEGEFVLLSSHIDTAAQAVDVIEEHIMKFVVEPLYEACDDADVEIDGKIFDHQNELVGSEWELDVFDMILNHIDCVNLENCDHHQI